MRLEETKEIQDTEQVQLDKKIKEFKKKYKKIYATTIADEKIIWRTLTRSEYKELMNLESENKDLTDRDLLYLREEALARKVILYPKADEIIEDIAAVAEVISTECMEKSGFTISNDTERL